MISGKKLQQLARKWRMAIEIQGKRISLGRSSSGKSSGDSNEESSLVIKKGHFTIYTTDGRRFFIPLVHLSNGVIRELFAIAEEEFGIPVEGPIVMPVEATAMEYIISSIRWGLSFEQEKALLSSFTRCNSYLTADKTQACPQIYVCS
ncbi:hypothetical protein MLD38_013627 [Melastoma candidum]|uniref:Uncharacterized protein n=1 Tax=Melastoma candidum TaxID=119954 RepID=A0ACB9RDB0_9MYRT|nr:hypothetical protein MLD38_013627 [Melastoma candidum]